MNVRHLVWVVAAAVAVTATIGFLATFPIQGAYTSRAVLAQRVQVDKTASDLFGESSQQKISAPEPMLIDDPKAFVTGTGDQGARLVSENYLVEHKIYPLQLRTVSFTISIFRLGFGIALLVSGLAVLLLRRKAA